MILDPSFAFQVLERSNPPRCRHPFLCPFLGHIHAILHVVYHIRTQFAKTQSNIVVKKNGTYKPRPKRVKVEKSEREAAPEAEDGGDSGKDEEAAPAPAPVVKKKKINENFHVG